MKVIDKLKRDVLMEGRSHQMGFALCKEIDENTLEAVQPISPCKDYLNDVVWAEQTGKEITAYGLHYKPQGLKKPFWYLAFKIQPNKYAGPYNKYEKMEEDKKRLAKNYKNILSIINYVEALLHLEHPSNIYKANDDIFVLRLSEKWCQYTYSISLYSLLVRMAQFNDGEDPDKFLEDYANNLDTGLWTPYKQKFEKILKTGFKEQDLSQLGGGTKVHNEGFCTTKLW